MGECVRGRPTWAEIDLAALCRNLARVRERAGARRVIAVVKADGYGHGAVPVARALEGAGAEGLAVATLGEASELRAAGLRAPLLLLQGLHDPRDAERVAALELTPMVGDLAGLEPLRAAARRAGRPLPIHLKLDTGMSRLGLLPEEIEAALQQLAGCRDLALEGVASHLAEADDAGSTALAAQRERFAEGVARVRAQGFAPDWVHLDNSAGVFHGPTPDTSAVRVGLALYGADPTLEGGLPLEPVMTLLTRVLRAVDLPAGSRVGYGGTWRAPRRTRIATLPIGYADGLPRRAGGRLAVGLGGRRLPLVGRVSMDSATADAGPGADVRAGDEVLLFGRRSGMTIRVEEVAEALDTIAYEVLVGIGRRVPRLHAEGAWSGSSPSEGGRSRG